MDACRFRFDDGGPAGGGALHNMSAPPTLRISIRPLTATPEDPVEGRLPVPGYRLLAQVDLDALLLKTFGGARPASKRRLAALVLLARGEPAGSGDVARLVRQTRETLGDELRELAARLDPRALGLPAFAIARTPSDSETPGGPEVNPTAAIALLTRTAGQVFVAGRSPRLAWLDDAVPVYRYFAPAPTGSGK